LDRFSSGSFDELAAERKVQLKRISQSRGRDVLAFAADINKNISQTPIDYSDLLPFTDQLSNLKGKQLDLILETPGGSGEVAEDLVKAMRGQFEDVAVIVPGYAKSAGTIMAMAADGILMGPIQGSGRLMPRFFTKGRGSRPMHSSKGWTRLKRRW
jgi:ClpP class serine protease